MHRAGLWILGEYATTPDDIQTVMSQIRQVLGEIPIVEDEMKRAAGEKTDDDVAVMQTTVPKLVTSDGTYATQSSFSTLAYVISSSSSSSTSLHFLTRFLVLCRTSKKGEARPPLRQYLMDGEFFIGAALGTTLAKLALRYNSIVSDKTKQNRFTAEAMLIM